MNVYKCIIYLGTAKIIKFVEALTPQHAIYNAADMAGLRLLSDAVFEVYEVA